MGARHTPGPWTIKAEQNVIGSGGRMVATCGGYQSGRNEVHGENCANARLIAAAPELAEALRDVMDRLEINTAGNWDAFVRASSALDRTGCDGEPPAAHPPDILK